MKWLGRAAQIIFSLLIGAALIWLVVKDLTPDNVANIKRAIADANYGWILASSAVALFSHYLRAVRWALPLRPLGINISTAGRYHAVMVGYLANLALPRAGEITRCALPARYGKLPFETLFGTVIAERVVDALVLLSLMAATVLFQAPIVFDLVQPKLAEWNARLPLFIGLALSAMVLMVIVLLAVRAAARRGHPFVLKIWAKVSGLLSGITVLMRMPGKWKFLALTVAIWAAYVLMFYLSFQTFDATSNLPIGAVLAAFTLGGITIVAVQGGLGAYPLAIMGILTLYGVNSDLGYALGWIAWGSQTALLLVFGTISLLALPFSFKSEV